MGGWIPPRNPDGSAIVTPEPRQGSSKVVVTHNWADKTTWFQGSSRVEGEELSDSGDGLTFESAHPFWIDLTHGKYYREDLHSAPYLPIVKVGGVEKEERAPWADSGGDYSIDYETGEVTFFEEQSGTVTADYSYAGSSVFTLAPLSGKILRVENSEIQFSSDIGMLDTIHFQAFVGDYPVGDPTTYKTLQDFVNEAIGVYPEVPAIGGVARGLQQSHVVFPFQYKTIKELASSLGLSIRIWLEDDKAYSGEFATATFYCTSKNEA